MSMPLKELVKRNQIVHPEHSAALGVPVAYVGGYRQPLGVIVEVTEDRGAVWVRRFDDPADTTVLYSLNEVEAMTTADLASVARLFLGRQYREAVEIKARIAHGEDVSDLLRQFENTC
jgi:hypothetical protein